MTSERVIKRQAQRNAAKRKREAAQAEERKRLQTQVVANRCDGRRFLKACDQLLEGEKPSTRKSFYPKLYLGKVVTLLIYPRAGEGKSPVKVVLTGEVTLTHFASDRLELRGDEGHLVLMRSQGAVRVTRRSLSAPKRVGAGNAYYRGESRQTRRGTRL